MSMVQKWVKLSVTTRFGSILFLQRPTTAAYCISPFAYLMEPAMVEYMAEQNSRDWKGQMANSYLSLETGNAK
ncbi:hypothetical protein D3C87_1909110 [compost metagenome]